MLLLIHQVMKREKYFTNEEHNKTKRDGKCRRMSVSILTFYIRCVERYNVHMEKIPCLSKSVDATYGYQYCLNSFQKTLSVYLMLFRVICTRCCHGSNCKYFKHRSLEDHALVVQYLLSRQAFTISHKVQWCVSEDYTFE